MRHTGTLLSPVQSSLRFTRPLQLLDSLNPFFGGGEMIDEVTIEGSTYAALPGKFEAGTPCISQAIGFGFAIDYLNSIGGMDKVHDYEKKVRTGHE
jgi:cysteine desulfurase/selenocysteine lyase